MCKARCRMFRSGLRSRYGGMVGSTVHDHIIVAAPHLADGAGVHAPVCAGYKRDLESLCMLADGMPYEKVAKYSKLTLEEVKALDAKKPA